MRKCIIKTVLPFASRFCHIFVFLHLIIANQHYAIMHTNANIGFYYILANISYFSHFCRYMCDTCVSYMYRSLFLGICANVSPPTWFAMLTATLSILDFIYNFFCNFFIFRFSILFIASCISIILYLPSVSPHNRTNVFLCTISHLR